jgi:FkbM family methyltransferase
MQSLNRVIYHFSLRGLGYNNAGGVGHTGEEHFIKVLARFSPRLCIDVGANKGNYSRALLALTQSNVIAFEPLPKAFDNLSKLSLEYPGRICVVQKGIGNENRELDLHYGTGDSELASFSKEVNEIGYVGEENKNVIKVSVLTLDTFFTEQVTDSSEIDLLKIDTEGYEYEVLRGAAVTLQTRRPKFIQVEFNWHQLFKNQSMFTMSALLPDYVAYQLLPYGSGLKKVDVKSPLSNIYQFSIFLFVRTDIDPRLQSFL